MRVEEQDVLSAGLESILSAIHDSIIDHCPKLLPLFRKLTSEIHAERAAFLLERSKLLGMVLTPPPPTNEKSSTGSKQRTNSKQKHPNFNPQTIPCGLNSPTTTTTSTTMNNNKQQLLQKAYVQFRNQRPTTISQQRKQYQLQISQQQPQQQQQHQQHQQSQRASNSPYETNFNTGFVGGIQFSYGPRDAARLN